MTDNAPWCLTLFDTSGIQDYIFGANRLRENTGGSFLVHQALDERLHQACAETLEGRVIWPDLDGEPTPLALPHNVDVATELIFEGGGNAAVLFRSREDAVKVVHVWSRDLLLRSPGLRVAVAHAACAPGGLKEAWGKCREQLACSKDAGGAAPPLEGLSLTRACRSTGLAAAGWIAPQQVDQDTETPTGRAACCLSPVAALRLAASDDARSWLRRQFPEVADRGFAFTDDVEQLGQRDGEQSLAVVHADGNGLGSRLRAIIEHTASDEALVTAVRAFARAVRDAARDALGATISWLMDRYDTISAQKAFRVVELAERRVLPLRPIVFGGDDVTFVCHGRLGLSLAARYLQYFAKHMLPDGAHFSACAGVAIVHTRAPFSRAYDLADALCSSAKKRSRERDHGRSSWLDAQLSLDSLGEPLRQVRDRLYQRPGMRLDWRPWQVTPDSRDAASWSEFAHFVEAVSRVPRSQRRNLMDALAAGDSAAGTALSHLAFRGRSIPKQIGNKTLENDWKAPRPGPDGESEKATPLYDPLELFDYAWEVAETREGVR